jgi:tetrathionate reductase subunit B
MNESLNIAQKCTGCAHLLDSGEWTEPRCVDACPTLALRFIEHAEAQELIKNAVLLHPEEQKPRVYYLNIPKKFIGGTVYDPVKKEVVIGATCTLTGDGRSITATTDGFGDFWFEGLEVGRYSLEIAAKGFSSRSFDAISTEADVNLGDIALAWDPSNE